MGVALVACEGADKEEPAMTANVAAEMVVTGAEGVNTPRAHDGGVRQSAE